MAPAPKMKMRMTLGDFITVAGQVRDGDMLDCISLVGSVV